MVRRGEGIFRLIATDLDGTLRRSDGTYSDRTTRAVRRSQAAGATVVLVSARSPRSVRDDAPELGVGGFAICANGATTYDLDAARIVAHRPLPADTAAKVVRALREHAPGVAFACERELLFSCEPLYDAYSPHAERGFEYVRADALELVAEPVTKLVVRAPELELEALLELTRVHAGSEAEVTASGEHFVEVAAAGVTKAAALAELCVQLAIEREDVVAFGDNRNDVPMLEWAGHGVAVANAHADAKVVADEITASNDDDGVAAVLERELG